MKSLPLDLDMLLRTVAYHYAEMHHAPDTLRVEASYDAFKRSLLWQWDVLVSFVSVEFVEVDPYASSSAMFEDIWKRSRLRVYVSAELPINHPLVDIHRPTGQTFNTVFRAIHDGLAHYPGLHSFGPLGEFRAFKAHARMLGTDYLAIMALATETLGQNAYYHCGPLPGTFAPQKAGILPSSIVAMALKLSV